MRIFLLCALLGALFLPTCAWSQGGRDMEVEAKIIAELKTIAPDMAQTFTRATTAMDEDDTKTAIAGFRAVLAKAPAFTPAMRRLGALLVDSGQEKEGMPLLEYAVGYQRSLENLLSLAQAKMSRDNATTQELNQAWNLLTEAAKVSKGKDGDALALQALLALKMEKEQDFRRISTELSARHPGEMTTHYFAGIQAAMDKQWIVAEQEIRRAEALGLPHEVAERILSESGIHKYALIRLALYIAGGVCVLWILGLLALLIVGRAMSAKTLRTISTSDPNRPTGPAELKSRQAYKRVIGIAGGYYFLSLPIVILIVLSAGGGVIYASIAITGSIYPKLVLLVALTTLVSAYQIIATLFMRNSKEDPGRPLREEEAPGLWRLVSDLAKRMGTRPVDEIRILPGTDMAVYEDGTRREIARDQGKRIMLLGVGLLEGFTQNGFRSVLAHEYGHFANRDTAGGEIAIRVNAHMIRSALGMAASGIAVRWNPAFQFMRLYHLIFRRISYGAIRLQEVLADRLAAIHFGARSFEEGLRHVIVRSVEFDAAAENEINAAVKEKREIANLYNLTLTDRTEVNAKIEKALNEKTTLDDTHPAPHDRFREVRRVTSPLMPDALGQVWELFADPEAIKAEMNAEIAQNIKEAIGEQEKVEAAA